MTKKKVGSQISKFLGRRGTTFSSMEKGAKFLFPLGERKIFVLGNNFLLGASSQRK
jgi:hypothetical protein